MIDCLSARLAAGYSLLEVLIAIFVLSFGLLSLASAGAAALRRTHDAYLYSLATVEAANLQEALQAGDRDNYYANDWRAKIVDILPDGEGELNVNLVSVCWTQHSKQFTASNKQNKICIKLGENN